MITANGTPRAGRRWRVALLGMLVGAIAGAGGAVLRSRWRGQDAPGAQEPEQLQAVVDLSRPPLAD